MKLKHEIKQVKNFVNHSGLAMVLYFKSKQTSMSNGWGGKTFGGNPVPEKLIATAFRHGGTDGNHVTMTYLNPEDGFKTVLANLNQFDELVILTGATATNLIKRYKAIEHLLIADKLYHNFSSGTDPEIFVEDKAGNVIPAFNFLKSKKEDNHTYWDGFQTEFFVHASVCLDEVTKSIYNGLKRVMRLAKQYNTDAKLSLKTVMEIPYEMLQAAKDEHVSLGCAPSFNIYGMKGEQVADPRQLTSRSTGGHLHFGTGGLDNESLNRVIKAMDAIIGVSCVALFQKFDNPTRRRLYGLAGEYRLPPHGIEYRTLSNAWLMHPFITQIVFDISRKAVIVGMNDYLKHWKGTEEETIRCINTCDVKLAQEIMLRNKEMLMQIYQAAYKNYKKEQYEALFKIFFDGAHTVIANPEDIENNWDLNKSDYVYRKGQQFRTAIVEIVDNKKMVA